MIGNPNLIRGHVKLAQRSVLALELIELLLEVLAVEVQCQFIILASSRIKRSVTGRSNLGNPVSVHHSCPKRCTDTGLREVRIAEGPTAIDAATQRRHFGFRMRLVDKLQPIGGGSGRGHPLSSTSETWMALDVTADLDGDVVSHEGPNVQAVRCALAFPPGEISGRC